QPRVGEKTGRRIDQGPRRAIVKAARGGRAIITPAAILWGIIMITSRVLVFAATAFAASAGAAHAAPCSGQIDAMQARIDTTLEAKEPGRLQNRAWRPA